MVAVASNCIILIKYNWFLNVNIFLSNAHTHIAPVPDLMVPQVPGLNSSTFPLKLFNVMHRSPLYCTHSFICCIASSKYMPLPINVTFQVQKFHKGPGYFEKYGVKIYLSGFRLAHLS